nr:glycosyltransferase-like domain-containing protein 1 isoform X2 [Paramormyrops kingsleyae]
MDVALHRINICVPSPAQLSEQSAPCSQITVDSIASRRCWDVAFQRIVRFSLKIPKTHQSLMKHIHVASGIHAPSSTCHPARLPALLGIPEWESRLRMTRVIFSSSVLNLAELIALRPDLAPLRKVLYFHENQLVYPVRKCQERDFQFGYNQILSCLVADVVLFNSSFNMESFLSSIPTFLKLMPDHRPAGLDALIRRKCRIYYFPLRFPDVSRLLPEHKRARCAGVVGPVGPQELGPPGDCPHSAEGLAQNTMPRASPGPDSEHGAPSPQHTGVPQSPEENYQRRESVAPPTEGGGKQSNTSHCQVEEECDDTASQQRPLHIVWPHRWEHDKDPELFLTTLLKLKEEGLSFQVSVLGETFTEVPDVFSGAREELAARVLHWGFLSSREQYLEVLCQADVVVSTARHEFFGVAIFWCRLLLHKHRCRVAGRTRSSRMRIQNGTPLLLPHSPFWLEFLGEGEGRLLPRCAPLVFMCV